MERRKGLALILISLSIFTVASFPEIHPANAQTLTRVGSLAFNTSPETDLASAVVDTAGGFAYFGTRWGLVAKIRMSDFSRAGSLALNPGETNMQSAVIDPAGGFEYFGADTAPGIVVKVRLSTFTRFSALTLNSGEDALASAVIDPTSSLAYFGTDTSPGIVVKVGLSTFTRVANLTLNPAESFLTTAVIDPTPGFAYFGASGCLGPQFIQYCQTPCTLVKLSLSNFTQVGSLSFNSGEINLVSSVIDSTGGTAYFGTDPFTNYRLPSELPGLVVKVDVSTFTNASAISMSPGETNASPSVIDSAAGFAYFGTSASLGSIVKIRLSNFTRVGALSLNGGESGLTGSFIDPAAEFAYFGTSASPGIIVKIRVSDFTRVGSLTLNRGDDNLGTAVVDSAGIYAYFRSEERRVGKEC